MTNNKITTIKRKNLHQLPTAQKKLMIHQLPYNILEQKVKLPVRLRGSQRTAPAVQAPNMIQQTIHGGPITHQSRRASSRSQRRDTRAPSRNPKHNLEGENLEEKDSEVFGNDFPSQAGSNCSIITSHNTR